MDIIATLPFDLVFDAVVNNQILKSFKLARAIKLVRVIKFTKLYSFLNLNKVVKTEFGKLFYQL